MRKRIFCAVAAAIACCLVLGGCDGKTLNEVSDTAVSYSSADAGLATADYTESEADSAASYAGTENVYASVSASSADSTDLTMNEESKKIYTGSIDMETTVFSEAYESIRTAAEDSGAWLESDSTGTAGLDDLSYANLTIRVPVDDFDALIESLEAIENVTVTSKTISTEDVSEDYYDIEGRLENAEAKLKKLQELAEEAENVEDMITIEDSISDVQYTIEYLQGQINRYDSRISYSTVYVTLDEVNVLKGQEEGYGNKLIAGLKSGFTGGVNFIGNLILWAAQNWLVILAVVVLIALLRKIHSKRKARRLAKKEAQKETKE